MKGATASVILAVAIGIFLPVAIVHFVDSPQKAPSLPMPNEPEWLETLVGTELRLPSVDAFGRPISERGQRLLVALSCASCSTKNYAPSDFVGPSSFEPTIVAFEARLDDVPLQFRDAVDLRVVCYPETNNLPKEIFMSLPQAFKLDDSRTVANVPDKGQHLSDFVLGLRGDNE